MRNLDRKLVKNSALVCGVDEVGRGAIAGPVVAAAVILCPDCRISKINDSKLLTPKQRERLVAIIKKRAAGIGVAAVSWRVIERENIARATFRAMRLAVIKALRRLRGDYQQKLVILADGWEIPGIDIPCFGIPKGDQRSQAIACASIVAKVFRDEIMVRYENRFPGYGFDRHKGYGTAAHIEALRRLGISPIHRRSFEPVKSFLERGGLASRTKVRQRERVIIRETVSPGI